MNAYQPIESRLLPELFSGFDDGDPLTVLDLGPGNPATVEYLTRFRARVTFADLIEHPVFNTDQSSADSDALAGFIERQINMPADWHIDICLMWDYLHHMDLASLEALSQVIGPRLHPGSRGYAFGALHGKRPLDNNEYGIANRRALMTAPAQTNRTYVAHSQQQITERFGCLRITRGTLLREGRLELLLEV